MAAVEEAEHVVLRGVVHVELVRADGVALHADAEELALDRDFDERAVVVGREDFVERLLVDRARRGAVGGDVLEAVGDPDVERGRRPHLAGEVLGDAEARDRVADPEPADLLVLGGERAAGRGERVGEVGGVEVEPLEAGLLGELHPRREVAGLERVAVDEAVLAEDRVVGMEVEAVRAGDQGEGLLDVGHQLLRVAGAAGVVAGRLDAAGERAVVVEADDVVALPAVHGDVEPFEGLQGGLDVDAEVLVEGFCGCETGVVGHGGGGTKGKCVEKKADYSRNRSACEAKTALRSRPPRAPRAVRCPAGPPPRGSSRRAGWGSAPCAAAPRPALTA